MNDTQAIAIVKALNTIADKLTAIENLLYAMNEEFPKSLDRINRSISNLDPDRS